MSEFHYSFVYPFFFWLHILSTHLFTHYSSGIKFYLLICILIISLASNFAHPFVYPLFPQHHTLSIHLCTHYSSDITLYLADFFNYTFVIYSYCWTWTSQVALHHWMFSETLRPMWRSAQRIHMAHRLGNAWLSSLMTWICHRSESWSDNSCLTAKASHC